MYKTQFEFKSASVAINASKSLKSNPEDFPDVVNICFKKSDFESYVILTTKTPESLTTTKEQLLQLEKEHYENKTKQYCYFEKQSKCTKSDCPYLHKNTNTNTDINTNINTNNNTLEINQEEIEKPKEDESYKQFIPCRFYFVNKNCLNENCPYSHDDTLSESTLKYYLKTPECKFNEKCTRPECPYLHIPDWARYPYETDIYDDFDLHTNTWKPEAPNIYVI